TLTDDHGARLRANGIKPSIATCVSRSAPILVTLPRLSGSPGIVDQTVDWLGLPGADHSLGGLELSGSEHPPHAIPPPGCLLVTRPCGKGEPFVGLLEVTLYATTDFVQDRQIVLTVNQPATRSLTEPVSGRFEVR